MQSSVEIKSEDKEDMGMERSMARNVEEVTQVHLAAPPPAAHPVNQAHPLSLISVSPLSLSVSPLNPKSVSPPSLRRVNPRLSAQASRAARVENIASNTSLTLLM